MVVICQFGDSLMTLVIINLPQRNILLSNGCVDAYHAVLKCRSFSKNSVFKRGASVIAERVASSF